MIDICDCQLGSYFDNVIGSIQVWKLFSIRKQLTLSSQASETLFSLKQYVYHLHDPEPKFVSDLLDKLILPILMYSCERWRFHKANLVEINYSSFSKSILHEKKFSSNSVVNLRGHPSEFSYS